MDFVEKRKRIPRKSDGGVYLVVVDESPEFDIALRYAARCAESRRGHVALLQVFDVDGFQDWGGVESRILGEMRSVTEQQVQKAAQTIYELTGKISAIYIAEGNTHNKVIDIINEDDSLVCLVLGGGVSSSGPGPMISHFAGKALGKLRIPVVVVPGNLDSNRIDAIT